jgi:hypothetical protein
MIYNQRTVVENVSADIISNSDETVFPIIPQSTNEIIIVLRSVTTDYCRTNRVELSTLENTFYRYFPIVEVQIISEVAEEYELTPGETRLLFSIRRVENSGCRRIADGKYIDGKANGMAFGVGDGNIDHPARRYAGDYVASLRLQAQWCAGSIVKRYRPNQDLVAFSKRWCPPNHTNWTSLVNSWMSKL